VNGPRTSTAASGVKTAGEAGWSGGVSPDAVLLCSGGCVCETTEAAGDAADAGVDAADDGVSRSTGTEEGKGSENTTGGSLKKREAVSPKTPKVPRYGLNGCS